MNSTQDPSIAPNSGGTPATGKLTTDFGGSEAGYSVAIQPDGKILVVGETYNYKARSFDLALARYDADGRLDKGFSGDGKLTTAFGKTSDSGFSVALLPDGKILVAGTSYDDYGSGSYFALARYNADGSLDKSFSDDGKLTTSFGGHANGLSVTVQPDGKILAAGAGKGEGSQHFDFALARYNADGSLDGSFSDDGKLTTDLGSDSDGGYGVVLQPDGKVLVAGTSNWGGAPDFALARYNADGSLDGSFSDDGKLTTDFSDDFAIGFSFDFGNAVALQPDGKVLVAGTTRIGNSSYFALVRYNTDGSLDKSFSGDGKLTTDFGSGINSGNGVVLQPDGKIVVTGSVFNQDTRNGDFALTRYNLDGNLDKSFSGIGKLTTDFNGDFDFGNAVVLQPDGKILVAGRSQSNAVGDFALARYNPDGSPDTTFGDRPPIGGTTAQLAVGEEDRAYTLKATDLLQGFTDPDGDALIVTGLTADHGALRGYSGGIWILTPAANYNGMVKLSYTVSDARGGNLTAQQSFTLAAVEDVPVIKPMNFKVAEMSAQGAAVGQVYGTDGDGDAPLAYRLASGNADWDGDGQPAFTLDAKTGALSVNDPGDLDYETHPAFSLEVTATDPGGLSGSGTLQILLLDFNEIHGTAGPDSLRGTSGKDWLDGGAGDDWLVGGQGDDALLGGDGNDRADFSKSLAPIRADLATGTATGQGADTLVGIENLTGGFAGDSLSGDANPNIFWGGPGDDGMEGNAGDDRLGGGLGNDTIKGGDGNDTLYGSKGLDTLAGGAGADHFLYKAAIDTGNTAAARDVIADFSGAEGDKLDVSAWDAQPSVAGLQHWSFVASFTGQAGQIRFDSSAQFALFDQDGDQQADFQIELTGGAALSAADFVLA